MMTNLGFWKKKLVLFFDNDNKHVSFRPLEQNKNQRIRNDIVFVVIFLLIPYFFSFTNTIFPNSDPELTLIIISFIKLVLYLAGYYSINERKRLQLKQNGGNAFFLSLFFMEILWVFISVLSFTVINDIQTSKILGFVLYDIFRVLVVLIVIIRSISLRKDIWHVIFNRLLLAASLIIIFYLINISVNPFFNWINDLLTKSTTSTNQASIDKTLSRKSFESYWLIITIAVTAPIFEEIVYRHSLMLIMDTKPLKFLVPFIHFAFIHVAKLYTQDFIHVFLYLWTSFIFTYILYMKKNVGYTIFYHMFFNQVILLS